LANKKGWPYYVRVMGDRNIFKKKLYQQFKGKHKEETEQKKKEETEQKKKEETEQKKKEETEQKRKEETEQKKKEETEQKKKEETEQKKKEETEQTKKEETEQKKKEEENKGDLLSRKETKDSGNNEDKRKGSGIYEDEGQYEEMMEEWEREMESQGRKIDDWRAESIKKAKINAIIYGTNHDISLQ